MSPSVPLSIKRLFSGIERFADQVALIDKADAAVTYAELSNLADSLVRPLGATRRLLVIEIANEVEPIAAYVGALRAGHVVALTAHGGADRQGRLCRTFNPDFAYVRRDGAWEFEARPSPGCDLHEDLAVLLSTSGTTGSPKLVRLSHEGLICNSQAIAEYLQFAPGERAITALPAHYSYGMSVINSHLVAGQTLVLTDESVAGGAFWDRVRRHGVTSLAGVPHTFEILERGGYGRLDQPSLRYFTQAGGRLAPDKVRAIAALAEARAKRFYVMYGQTEAGPRMAYVPPQDIAAHPDAIGVPIPGGELFVDPIEGVEGGVGELVYRGPNVMMGYALTPADLARDSGPRELRTGDLAVAEPNGFFRLTGRANRIAKIFGSRVALDDVEAILAGSGVEAAVGGDDEGLVVAITAAGREDAVRGLLSDRIGLPANRIAVRAVEALPRNAAGKIAYASVMALRESTRPPYAATALGGEFADILGVDSIGEGDTFVTLGGDSLSYVQASMVLEERLGATPDDWENTPIVQLEQRAAAPERRVATLEASIFLRAVAIMAIVASHVADWRIGGFAAVLLVIAGMNFSRFQLPRLDAGGSFGLLQTTAVKVVLPYFLVISLYTLLIGKLFVPQYLLFSNFTDGLVIDGRRRFQIYWFIELYLSLIIVASLIWLSPAVRRFSANRPRTTAWTAFALTAGLAAVGTRFPETPAFYANTPLALGFVFAFGWMVTLLKSMREKLLLVAVGAACAGLFRPDTPFALPVLGAGVLVLLFVKRIPVGATAARALSLCASASLHIYIFHGLVLHAARTLARSDHPAPWSMPLIWLACLGLGVVVWRGSELIEARQGARMLADRRFSVVRRARRMWSGSPAQMAPAFVAMDRAAVASETADRGDAQRP